MGRSLYRDLNRRFGPRVDGPTRREVLKGAVAAGAALLISGSALARAARLRPSAGNATGAADGAKRVVVIGAGLGGLACACELRAAGYDVTVLEARDRVGGRVLSFNKDLGSEFIPGRNVEGGGELIGSNHPAWAAYAARFGLEFLEIKEGEGLTYPVVIDGRALEPKEAEAVWDRLGAALREMDPVAATIDADRPWASPAADDLDRRTLQFWIDALDVDPLTRKACWINLTADNGVDPSAASFLGQLAAVKGGGVEKYWTDTEVYRCKGGNTRLARALLGEIGAERVLTSLPVTRVALKGRTVTVSCAGGRSFECDDVVLATPPGVWSKIDFDPGLPKALRPQMGMNVKYLAHLRKRFWGPAKLSPDALGNGPVQLTWDGTDGQPGDDDACMVAFSGGPRATRVSSWDKGLRDEEYAKALSAFYPAWREHFVGARFMDWPRDPWTMASYSFPAPGQVTSQGPTLARGALDLDGHPRLHFAGEHTCPAFPGYMEGALRSGAEVAKRLAARDGVLSPAK